LEIAFFLFFRRDVQQPEQKKERHHGGDEVGIGDFPGTAVVAATFFNPLDDDRLLGFIVFAASAISALPSSGAGVR
jgi:hypothetical protein